MPHAHTWHPINAALRRYRCDCGVIGHARSMGRRGILPYECQHELGDRSHCGAPATYVTSIRTQSRCDEHRATDAQNPRNHDRAHP